MPGNARRHRRRPHICSSFSHSALVGLFNESSHKFIVFYSSWPPKKKEITYPGLVKNNFSAGTVNFTIGKILTVNMGNGVRLIYPLLPYSDKVRSCRLGF